MNGYGWQTKTALRYTKETVHDAFDLMQDWQARQFWYPTHDYVTWLERMLERRKNRKAVPK